MDITAPVFICVDGVTYYELLPNSTLRVGRTDANDIVLDDYKVSREHALIKYHGNDIIVIDLASTHGSMVGGERVTQHILTEDEKLHIVSHELHISLTRPVDKNTEATSRIVSATPQHMLDRRVKFFGGLNEFCLLTLVQFLHQEKQSGLLMLEEGQNPGPRIYFLEGDIIHVQNDEELSELMTRQQHQPSLFFYFHHETQFPARTIRESTPNYLMELCHKKDMQDLKNTQQMMPLPPSRPAIATPKVAGTVPRIAGQSSQPVPRIAESVR